MIRISIAEGGKPPRLVTFSKAQVTLGRAEHHDLSLQGKGVSSTHCRLLLQGGQLYIEDLGSTNGTYVNRARISVPTPIGEQDDVVVAVYRLRAGAAADAAAPSAPPPSSAPYTGVPGRATPPTVAQAPMLESMPGIEGSGPTAIPMPTVEVSRPQNPQPNAAQIEWEREWERIERLANEWQRAGRRRALLLRGDKLEHARRWLSRARGRSPAPKRTQREFIEAATRRHQLRLLSRVTLGGLALGGLVVGGVLAHREWKARQARGDDDGGPVDPIVLDDLGAGTPRPTVADRSRADAIAATAAAKLPADPALAALLAADAIRRLPAEDRQGRDEAAAAVIRRALAQLASRPLYGHGAEVTAVALSPDGRIAAAATARRGDPIRLWDLSEPGLTRPKLLSNHAGRIIGMAATDDGKWLLTADDDGLVMRWDITDRDPATTGVRMEAHVVAIEAMAAAGSWLATGDGTGRVKLWDVSAPRPSPIGLVGTESKIVALAVLRDGSVVVAAGDDGIGRMWRIAGGASGRPVELTRPEEQAGTPLTATALSPDGAWALLGAGDGLSWLYPLATRLPSRGAIALTGHAGPVRAVAFSPDGAVAISASADDSVRLYEMSRKDPNEKVTPWPGHEADIAAIDVTGPPPGTSALGRPPSYLLTASADGTARRWDVDQRDGPIQVEVLGDDNGPLRVLDASADGRFAITGGADAVARVHAVWRGDRADRRRVPGLGAAKLAWGHVGPIRALAMNAAGTRVVTGGDDGTARAWDVTGAGPPRALGVLGGHPGKVGAVAVDATGRYAATGSTSGDLRLWDLKELTPGQGPVALVGHTQDIQDLVFTDTYLVSVSLDHTARLWRVDTPADAAIVLPHGGEVVAGAVSSDGRWLATISSTELRGRIWDLGATDPTTTAVEFGTAHADALTAVAIAPDRAWVASGGLDTQVLFSRQGNEASPTRLRGHDAEILVLSASPDGRWLASADSGGRVMLWDASAEHPDESRRPLPGPSAAVRTLSWSPDGALLLGGGDDDVVFVWRADDPGGEPMVLEGHEGVVSRVAMGRTPAIVSAAWDGTARVWPLAAGDLVPLACAAAGRTLTPEEWTAHVGAEPFVDPCG